VYMTDATYKIMKDYLGEEFEYKKDDVVCSPCLLKVKIAITICGILSNLENICTWEAELCNWYHLQLRLL